MTDNRTTGRHKAYHQPCASASCADVKHSRSHCQSHKSCTVTSLVCSDAPITTIDEINKQNGVPSMQSRLEKSQHIYHYFLPIHNQNLTQ